MFNITSTFWKGSSYEPDGVDFYPAPRYTWVQNNLYFVRRERDILHCNTNKYRVYLT